MRSFLLLWRKSCHDYRKWGLCENSPVNSIQDVKILHKNLEKIESKRDKELKFLDKKMIELFNLFFNKILNKIEISKIFNKF